METILVMLSGGLDSVYMLYHYLTETRYPLHVHHISIRYPHLNRWKMEDPASRKIVDYCRKQYRDFEYSESRFDMQEMNEVGMDSDLHLLVAAKLAPNLIAEKVSPALGKPWEPPEDPDHIGAGPSVPSSPGDGQADAMPETSPSTAANVYPSTEPSTSPTQHAVRVASGRVHSPRFKSQVALAALRNSQSKAQLAERFKLDPDLIEAWVNTVLENAVMLFERS